MHLSAPPRPHRFLKSLPGALQPPACPVGPIQWQCLAWGTSLGLAVPQGGADARLTALQRGRSGDPAQHSSLQPDRGEEARADFPGLWKQHWVGCDTWELVLKWMDQRLPPKTKTFVKSKGV